MNVRIVCYFAFEGDREELTPLLDTIADALVSNGFGNNEGEDADLVSLITIGESGIAEYTSADEFAKMILEDKNLFTVVIPIKEENNVSSGNQRQASSTD